MTFVFALFALGLAIASFIQLNTLKGKVEFLQKHIWSLERRMERGERLPSPEKSDEKAETPFVPTPLKSAEIAAKQKQAVLLEKTSLQAGEAALQSKKTPKEPWHQAKKITAQPVKVAAPKKSLEELIGAQWSVWVGGVALLFGAIFLLRYSIEAGVFTPAMRVTMAALFGVALLGVGEWLHRGDLKRFAKGKAAALAEGISEKAYIPTLLTAIGVFTLYGTIYAAYALYDFIDAIPAFSLLGLISLGALALSFRHGPVLAAVGLAGSLVTPLLVQTDTPNVYMLYGYLIVIGAAALLIARIRNWGWLNLATLFGLLMWSGLSLKAGQTLSTAPVWFAFLGLGFGVSCYIANRSYDVMTQNMTLETANHNTLTATIWSIIAALLVVINMVDATVSKTGLVDWLYSAGLVSAGLLMAASWVFKKQIWYMFVSVALAFSLIVLTHETYPMWQSLIILGAFSVGLMAFTVLRILKNATSLVPALPLTWVAISTAYPLVILLLLYGENFTEHNTLFAGAFGITSLTMAGLALYLRKDENAPPVPSQVLGVGSAIGYFFAVMIGFDGHAETLGLMGGIILFGLAAWYWKALIPRIIAVVFALISAAHSLIMRIGMDEAVLERFIFNELWLYFAFPALICAGGAWLLSRNKTDIWSEALKALSLTFSVLFIVFQIRHIMNGGNVLAPRLSFDELALQVVTGLSFSLGATKLSGQDWDPKASVETQLLPTLAMAISSVSLVIFLLGVCLGKSPLFNASETVNGNFVLNSLTLAYFVPTILLSLIAVRLRNRRPEKYIQVIGGLALLSLILFITSLIRFVFSGEMISIFERSPEGIELYAISAAWLLFGIALLVVGIKKNRLDLRMASAVLITLTILKAFFIDMAELEGVLRALSFVVLGLILIVIGRSYQKILFSKSTSDDFEAQETRS